MCIYRQFGTLIKKYNTRVQINHLLKQLLIKMGFVVTTRPPQRLFAANKIFRKKKFQLLLIISIKQVIKYIY